MTHFIVVVVLMHMELWGQKSFQSLQNQSGLQFFCKISSVKLKGQILTSWMCNNNNHNIGSSRRSWTTNIKLP